jgi:hypothetical protein
LAARDAAKIPTSGLWIGSGVAQDLRQPVTAIFVDYLSPRAHVDHDVDRPVGIGSSAAQAHERNKASSGKMKSKPNTFSIFPFFPLVSSQNSRPMADLIPLPVASCLGGKTYTYFD